MFDSYIMQAGLIIALCSGLPVLAGSVCALLVAVLQTASQIQEQSLSYFVKFCVVALVLCLGWDWFSAQLVQFTTEVLGGLAYLGRIR